jgi:hypothetical protein
MSVHHLPVRWTADDVLQAVAHWPLGEIKLLAARLASLGAGQRASRLPAAEATLLKEINVGFSEVWWAHYDHLLDKRRQESLSTTEHRELIHLTDQIEKREPQRVKALVKLARLRK